MKHLLILILVEELELYNIVRIFNARFLGTLLDA